MSSSQDCTASPDGSESSVDTHAVRVRDGHYEFSVVMPCHHASDDRLESVGSRVLSISTNSPTRGSTTVTRSLWTNPIPRSPVHRDSFVRSLRRPTCSLAVGLTAPESIRRAVIHPSRGESEVARRCGRHRVRRSRLSGRNYPRSNTLNYVEIPAKKPLFRNFV